MIITLKSQKQIERFILHYVLSDRKMTIKIKVNDNHSKWFIIEY